MNENRVNRNNDGSNSRLSGSFSSYLASTGTASADFLAQILLLLLPSLVWSAISCCWAIFWRRSCSCSYLVWSAVQSPAVGLSSGAGGPRAAHSGPHRRRAPCRAGRSRSSSGHSAPAPSPALPCACTQRQRRAAGLSVGCSVPDSAATSIICGS